MTRRRRSLHSILVALGTAAGVLALAPAALAGRLIETGHDIDFHCGGSQNTQCHFVKVAVSYVRGGAPDPSKPLLVLDRDPAGINVPDVVSAVNKAFGAGAVPMTVVDPRSATFTTTPIDTAHFSAIFVASDINCGGCDLNEPPSGSAAQTPDSTAITGRTDDIAAFFRSGGGIFAGAGDLDAGRFGGTTFTTPNVPFYSFMNASPAGPVGGPFTLTSLGVALGLTSTDLGFASCGVSCTHNAFRLPPVGSRLKAAETDSGSGRYITLVEDTDPPAASITSGPSGATASSSATFAFGSNEGGSLQCRVDNAAFATCTSPKTVSGLADGKHTFNVRAIDLVGNVQASPATFSWCQPGGAEVTGNKVDEDCDSFSEPFGQVEGTIRFSFHLTRSRTQITTLNLSKVTSKAKLKVTCKGKGCPFKSKSVKLKKGKAKLSRIFKKHRRRAKLRKGARIRISLTKKGLISKVYSFKVRRGALPSFSTRCQLPGSKKLRTRCPTFK